MPSIEKVKASDGSGNASVATVTTVRAPAASTILVDTVQGIPTNFMGSMGTPHTFIDPVTNETITVISEDTAVDFSGHVDGSNLEIDTIAPGYTDAGSLVGDIIMIRPTTQWGDNLAAVLGVSMNDNGTLKAVTEAPGYTVLAQTPDTVALNGNRSYDLTFNSVDLTAALSPGMRLKMTRTVTAPTQCADLEASSSQYFNKTTPAGTTFTDDFCAGAWVKLESYPAAGQSIMSRYNGTSGWRLLVTADGRAMLQGTNAGASNFRRVSSYQSIPLGRWVYISAQLDMSAYTLSATTCYVMFDGVDVPAKLETSGTNPTALVQAGNLEIGAENSGTLPFDGKLAQVFYSSAKITQANMRLLQTQGLTAALCTTHSIVSAYSLSNSLVDINTTNANDLAAQGGALATNTDSPFAGGNVSEFTDGTIEMGIITKAVFSTNTTLTVQVPEGYALPTSGGISAVAYSTQKVPYGFPANRGKWTVLCMNKIAEQSGLTADVWSYMNAGKLNVPIGAWDLGYSVVAQVNATVAGASQVYSTLAQTSAAEDDKDMSIYQVGGNVGTISGLAHRRKPIDLSSAIDYFLNIKVSGSGTLSGFQRGDLSTTIVQAECAYL